MGDTPNLGLKEMISGQAYKEVTFNEALYILDCLIQATALNVINEPAGGESNGDCYLVGDTPVGDFAEFTEHDIAMLIAGAWIARTPKEGWRIWVQDEDILKVFDGAAWGDYPGV
jgi:hypothetical protein